MTFEHWECVSWAALACLVAYRVGGFVEGRRMTAGLDRLRDLAAARGRHELAHEFSMLVNTPASELRQVFTRKCCSVLQEEFDQMGCLTAALGRKRKGSAS